MKDITCQLEHSVEADVSPLFVWNWRIDIRTWDDPPAQFQLDGPFASGSWGTTLFPGREPLRWQIRDVRSGAAFIIEVPLDGAVMSLSGWLTLYRTTEPGSRNVFSCGASMPCICEPSSRRFRLDPRRRHEVDRRRVGEGRVLNDAQQY